MEDYFRDLAGRSADEALNRAQDLMYQAWEARTTLSAVTLAKRALKTSHFAPTPMFFWLSDRLPPVPTRKDFMSLL